MTESSKHRSVKGVVITAALGCLVLSGCNSPSSQPSAKAAPSKDVVAADQGVIAFRDICLKTAPSFTAAFKVASRYGIKSGIALNGGQMGMNADQSLSLQVKPNAECSVTTSGRPDNGVEAEFLSVLNKATGSAHAKVPIVAEYKGVRFIFQHDRKGGEAYVMLHGAR